MNQFIWKYPIRRTDRQEVPIPQPCEILHVGFDPGGQLCVWALVKQENEIAKPVVIWLVGTGNPFPAELTSRGKYIGTIQDSVFMWHVFEELQYTL